MGYTGMRLCVKIPHLHADGQEICDAAAIRHYRNHVAIRLCVI